MPNMEELGNNFREEIEKFDGEKVTKCNFNEQENNKVHFEEKKFQRVLKSLAQNDYYKLKREAVYRGGLMTDDLRRKIWPKLIKVDVFETSPKPSTAVIEAHHYYTQVVLDVNRSLKRFPPSIAERQRISMQDQLVAMIMRVLIKHPDLHYYQGYHDICVTFLLVLGEEIAFNVVEKLSTGHLRLFMDETMQRTSEHLHHIYPLIGRVSSKLRDFLERSEVGVMFCLSWIITWYGHVLENYDVVVRMFDLFLASHPWMPLYLAGAIVLYREEDIMKQECDMACVHSFLSRLSEDLPFEDLVVEAQCLFKKFPPELLEADRRLDTKGTTTRTRRIRSVTGYTASALRSVVNTVMPYTCSSKALSVVIVIAAVVIYQVYKHYK